jgi:hypothetical protein
MTTETNTNDQNNQKAAKQVAAASAPVYGIGLLGAWFYYLTTATSFWDGLLGIFKGVFWPAVLVYELMKFFRL